MIFREELAAQIVKGEKTATRRLPSDNPRSPWRLQRPWRYPVGKEFTINPGRGVDAIARVVVTRRYMQPLICVENADAKKEGFRTAGGKTARTQFLEAFEQINGDVDFSLALHVIEFNLIGPGCGHCDGCGWCEGSPAWTCTHCFGTGYEPSAAARILITRLEKETVAA